MNTYYNNNPKETSNKEDILVTKQQAIGWKKITRGRVSSEFDKRMINHYKGKHIIYKFTSKRWGVY